MGSVIPLRTRMLLSLASGALLGIGISDAIKGNYSWAAYEIALGLPPLVSQVYDTVMIYGEVKSMERRYLDVE